MKPELLSDTPSRSYSPLIVDMNFMYEWGNKLGQDSRFLEEPVLQKNNLFSLAFESGNKNYQFKNLSYTDYTAVLSWLKGDLENNTFSSTPLSGALTGLAVGLGTSSFNKTRRDFLKGIARTAGLTALGAAAAGCGPRETISSQTEILLQTATAIYSGEVAPTPEPVNYRTPLAETIVAKTQAGYTISTVFPEETPPPTLTMTEVLKKFTKSDWAVNKETGKLTPEKMFPLIGAINYKHHNMVDLSYY